MPVVIVDNAFDDLKLRDIRFLAAASRHGHVHAILHNDNRIMHDTGRPPKFPFVERKYLLEAIRFVDAVFPGEGNFRDALNIPLPDQKGLLWAIPDWIAPSRRACSLKAAEKIKARPLIIAERDLPPLPPPPRPAPVSDRRPKVIVTGCYDWFHSGHVRFFEEASSYGELYVVVGSDANVRLLKGPGHPMFPQDERRYLVAAVRTVALALISSGAGWLDAEPEIEAIRPDCYVVNEDGDKPEKRDCCERRGIRYIVLRRTPKDGLPPRKSTDLRGF